MREIKFRGLTSNNEFVYGDIHNDAPNDTLYYKEYSQRICWKEGSAHCNRPVKNGTVGQFTDLKDKNDVDIYEGDIIKFNTVSRKGLEETVRFECGAFMPFFDNQYIQDEQGDWFEGEFEVIGNVHQHPNVNI